MLIAPAPKATLNVAISGSSILILLSRRAVECLVIDMCVDLIQEVGGCGSSAFYLRIMISGAYM